MELFHYPERCNVRTFYIEAIEIPIVYNKYGDHDPNGLLYVLQKDAGRIQRKALENFHQAVPQPYEEVRPLVLRANLGDEIRVHFRHSLDRELSIHVQGLSYDVQSSDGSFVGMNADSTTGNEINYCWYAQKEGVYLFSDMGDTRSSEEGTNIHGLFGAIIVEAPESIWLDPMTGQPIESGLFADIYHLSLPAFREYAVFFHDELEMKNKDGLQPVDMHTGLPSATTGISYRSEPMRNRMPLSVDHADTGEDISMSSWVYGDPAPPILRSYVGDPSKIRLVHGGVKETHVFHLHNHQWRLEGDNLSSTIIDSISISPQECYTLDILHGAGSLNGMIGDAIFHCHLYPHFHEGMWTLWRIYDRLQDGNQKLPDGTVIPPLLPLKDRVAPPEVDPDHPGYPNYINGQYGQRPLQPPLGILNPDGSNKIFPTPLEMKNFVEDYKSGALYTDTCPCHTDGKCGSGEKNVKVFELAVIQAKITYNDYGWHDPQGRFFVLKEELELHGGLDAYIRKVENQEIRVEPLVIRANDGDCIEIRLTNLLPEYLEASPFQLKTLTDIVGYHIHLVKFDTIVSDGAANGWNNIAGARRYETLIERFFANTELRAVFFHDHLYANSHQQHGVFGSLIVEEAGATFHDIHTGEELKFGTQAVIRRRDGSSFREFALFVHDFALLFDKDGKPLNPPAVPGSHDDPGVMGINYRSEPMRERLKSHGDPAYIFSSYVHGDPATPLLQTYPGDEMIIRLLDGAHEEQHSLNITGLAWQKEIQDIHSPLAASQTIGISEAFNLRIQRTYGAGDYLYYFGGIDDAWLGLWGIIRAYDKVRDDLLPICRGKAQILPLLPCPGKDAVIRKYEIAAVQTDLLYNRYGDHDPDGLIFVPVEELPHIYSGKSKPKPLILRANAGDWVEVTLHNLFSPDKPIPYYDYPIVPLDMKHQPSDRVSLNPQFLKYNPITDSGINVGYNNREQTVGPGESIKYLWHADLEYGACILQSFADMRNHRYHGLFGAIIVEPPASRWYRNFSMAKGTYDEQAVITAPGVETFREFVLFIQNGIRLLDIQGQLIQTAAGDPGEPVDAEDTGEKGYNYRSERFFNRLKKDGRISRVFSSKVHGDPATPIFKSYTGDRIVFRTMMPADKPRNVGLAVHGHLWKEQPKDPFSRIIPLQGGISIGNKFDMELSEGAACPGDYLYRSGSLKWDIESGMWGILRVLRQSLGCKCKNVCKKFCGCFKKN
ncbi:multicopper oxidase domain-containing protein [Diplocloster modestus]|uniref:Multicopper oxidase domain-containing protein n=1 Tax=Diplocloster modestus TaxID=2850322 RepID=A0ABS6KDS1_9FIRM|nr:multicopper oxidase domain-containing protein [Diplocloster modestus]MBU9728667.1 multicopper oxidase domain-containing protein [Diplocloster modestus]